MTDTSNSDFWHVEVAPGDVRVVSLEQLDDAFQRDVINVDTRVWQEGLPSAIRLGDLLGGDDSDDDDRTPVDMNAGRHSPVDQRPHDSPLPTRPRESQDTLIGLSPPDEVTPSPYPRSPTPAAGRPAESEPMHAGPWAQPAAAPMHAMPNRPSAAAPAMPPTSIAPLALDVGDEFAFARPNRAKQVAVALGGLVAIAAAIAVIVNVSGSSSGTEEQQESQSAAAAAPGAPEPFKGKAYDPGAGPVNVSQSGSLNELTVRDSPGEASKPRDETTHIAKAHWQPKPKKTANEFKSKGKNDAYDPLNGSLR